VGANREITAQQAKIPLRRNQTDFAVKSGAHRGGAAQCPLNITETLYNDGAISPKNWKTKAEC